MVRYLAWAALVVSSSGACAAENRLKNGSFEGSTQYWITSGVPTEGASPSGQWHLAFADKGEVRSGSFPLQPGEKVTISLYGRAIDADARVGFSLCPSNRQVAQASTLIWNKNTGYGATLTSEWQRYEWTYTVPDVDNKGSFPGSDITWWNRRSWVIAGSVNKACTIDGFTVAVHKEAKESSAAKDYIAHAPIEVSVNVLDLPGYEQHANLVQSEHAGVQAHVFNPGTTSRALTVRWELLDYRGERRFGNQHDLAATIAPGTTQHFSYDLPLFARGLALARVSVLDEAGTEISHSDHPLTRLAFPKNATAIDRRERFGASLRGGPLSDAAQAIGLRWTRWGPAINWAEVQPEGPDDWQFPDAKIDDLAAHGIAMNGVLYSVPKWARGEHKNAPKDMPWPAADPCWQDLTIVTGWDTFVTRTVAHFAGRVDTWEFANEPDLSGHWDAAIYASFAKRTYQLVKKANPNAQVLVNQTWPGSSGWTLNFLKNGGLEAFDVHSFHNYGSGKICDPSAIENLFTAFASFGDKEGRREVWFNEGWTYVPTSIDYASLPIINVTPAQVAHNIVHSATELTAAGMNKLICFHIGYGKHGKSFWDWVGSGTEWWDDHGNPTVAVGVWNNLCHHLGLSTPITTIHTDGGIIHVFQDMRNNRGIAVAWADKIQESLRFSGQSLTTWDCMGNADQVQAAGSALEVMLPADGVPVFFSVDGVDGDQLATVLAPLTKVDPRLIAGAWIPPKKMIGSDVNGTAGNPALVDGHERWKLMRLWPDNPLSATAYQLLQWGGTHWIDRAHSHGGQPSVKVSKNEISFGSRTAWGGDQNANKLAALVFVPPQAGAWKISATVRADIWHGQPPVALQVIVLQPNTGSARLLDKTVIPNNRQDQPWSVSVELQPNEEIAFVPTFENGRAAMGFALTHLVAVPVK